VSAGWSYEAEEEAAMATRRAAAGAAVAVGKNVMAVDLQRDARGWEAEEACHLQPWWAG